MIPDDLPQDMPSFIERFGSDEQGRDDLFKVRWPEGFRCVVCGHDDAYALKTKIVDECVACRKQHSLLAGTMLEPTKTGLSRWFLAIDLVTSSKGGIAATELQRPLGFASYGPAWTWLPTIRKAMLRPGRAPLAGRVEADETLLGGPKPGKRGRGAAGKTLLGGAVETGRGKARGRRLGRLRLAMLPDASARSLEAFLTSNLAKPAAVASDGWRGYAGLPAAGYDHAPVNLSTAAGDAAWHLPAIHLVVGLAKRWLLGTHHGAVSKKHLPPTSTSTCSASTAAPPRASATPSPASSSRPSRPSPAPTARSSPPQPQPDGHR
jgi:ISXO2 transposase-like protein/transposase-like zinc ribbon protein